MGTLLVIGGIPSLGMGHLYDVLNTFSLPIEFTEAALKIIGLSRRLLVHARIRMSESETSCPFPNTLCFARLQASSGHTQPSLVL